MLPIIWPLLICSLAAADPGIDADLVLRGGLLQTGNGQAGQVGDLALRGERIVGIGDFKIAGSPRVIDAHGLVIAPGFIDLHTHSDVSLHLSATRANLCYLRQGVTLVVTGNCGSGPVDAAAYFA